MEGIEKFSSLWKGEAGRDFPLETPRIFAEIGQFGEFKKEEAAAKEKSKKAEKMLTLKEIGNDGRFITYDDA